jgi:hypothetical protein
MNWTSVFAPTLRCTSLRVILALASYHDYVIEQMDVVTTFLSADVVSDRDPHGPAPRLRRKQQRMEES